MDKSKVLNAFAALGQETRLDVFRLLVKSGDRGMLAGEIGEALSVRQNTMSSNLSILLASGLVQRIREGRSIRYFVNFEGMRGLLAYLMEDCCGGRPEQCQPVINEVACAVAEDA